ncbi:MAG: hypothetical protein M1818_003885 [Claussenomyces sp. TS43310]|nr:MAG: hypothetical protein M1818_003885 [Claussenomyces sp. TS43310]
MLILWTAVQVVLTAFLARKAFTYFSGKHHLVEQELHAKYGPVVRTGPTSLSFSNLSDFEAIYGFNKAIEKGDFYSFGRDRATQAGSIFSARTDAEHREHKRRVVGPALTSKSVATYAPLISKNVAIFLDRLEEACTSGKEGSAVNVAPDIHRFTFDTLMDIIYGEALSSQPWTSTPASRGVLDAFRKMSIASWGTAMVPWLSRLLARPPIARRLRGPTYDENGNLTGVSALAARSSAIIFGKADVILETQQPSIAKAFLAVPDSDPTHMKADEVWRQCFNLTFAGPGSTAAALTAVLHQLGTAKGRQWQDRIHNAGIPTASSSIAFTAVFKETLRLHAPFPTAFPREIAPGGEHAIPSLPAALPVGTLVSANTYVLGRSPALWGADAAEWKPERWLVDDASERRALDDKFVAFSKGARSCIGRDIATVMIERAVCAVLERWEVRAKGPLRGLSYLEMRYDHCDLVLGLRAS